MEEGPQQFPEAAGRPRCSADSAQASFRSEPEAAGADPRFGTREPIETIDRFDRTTTKAVAQRLTRAKFPKTDLPI